MILCVCVFFVAVFMLLCVSVRERERERVWGRERAYEESGMATEGESVCIKALKKFQSQFINSRIKMIWREN